jgi:SAM-dependent methyltransferase
MVRSSEALWKEGGGYYADSEEELKRRPLLPNPRKLLDRRVLRLLERYVDCDSGSTVLEIGCGRSRWLAHLAARGCSVVGLDIEPFAARLARANLLGARASGEVLCRDAFDLEANRDLLERFALIYSWGVMEHFDDPARRLAILAQYLRPEGRILTIVPNLQGVNRALQRFADRERYEMHVIYDRKKLAGVHEEAGLRPLEGGYVGFCDGYLSAAGVNTGPTRRRIHERLCWMLGMTSEAWCRAGGKIATPELYWLSPLVFCVAERR